MINLKYGSIKEPLPKRILDKFSKEAFKDVISYPMNYEILTSRLAKKFKINVKNVILTNGVDEGIELLARVFKGDILAFTPTYYEFDAAPKRNNFKYELKYCFDGKGYNLRYSKDEIKNRTLIYLCNPNNPFGILTKDEIISIARGTKGIVAVDETYINFGGESCINLFNECKNLVILQSFSKAYSIAGLRIGYMVGHEDVIKKVNDIKLICNVTSVSVYAAGICLDEEKHFLKMISDLKARKEDFEEFMIKQGFNVIRTHNLTIMTKFEETKEAKRFNEFLNKNDVFINIGDGISTCGLDETFIRFSCGTAEQMKAVKKIVKRYR